MPQSPRLSIVDALKDAVLAALVAFGLFFFLIGLRSEQGPSGALEVATRFPELAALVGAVFAGAFLRALIFGRGPIGIDRAVPAAATRAVASVARFAAPALLLFAVLVPVLFYHNRYILDLGILVLTYVMLGWGLNIVVGLAGLLDLGYVAFYAVGGYTYALLSTEMGLSFWVVLPIAGMIAASFGILLGFPVLRLRGDYLAIVTLGFGEIIRLVLINWVDLTHGPDGIRSIPGPTFFGAVFAETAPAGRQTFAEMMGLPFSATQRLI